MWDLTQPWRGEGSLIWARAIIQRGGGDKQYQTGNGSWRVVPPNGLLLWTQHAALVSRISLQNVFTIGRALNPPLILSRTQNIMTGMIIFRVKQILSRMPFLNQFSGQNPHFWSQYCKNGLWKNIIIQRNIITHISSLSRPEYYHAK